jgi:hypothetical protein
LHSGLFDAIEQGMAKGKLSAWLGLAVVCVSCGGLQESNDPNHCLDTYCVGGEESLAYTAAGGRSLHDVLVVIDDSIAQGPRAPILERALRDMMKSLQNFPGDNLFTTDLNLALVPASLASSGSIDLATARLWPDHPACFQPGAPYLHDARMCDSPSNYQGTADEALACAALHMPATGLASRPLETIRALLAPGGLAESSGFRRKDAQLAVMVVTTEDDPAVASPEQRTEYADFLAHIAQDPDLMPDIAVVAPAAAQGLVGLAKLMRGAFNDIDADAWAGPSWITQERERGLANLCVDWPVVDVDAAHPGAHPDCYVAERDVSESGVVEHPIPFCQGDAADADPCWKTRLDLLRCPDARAEFQIVRSEFACIPSYIIKYQFTCAVNLQVRPGR